MLDEEFEKSFGDEVAKIGKLVGGPNGIIAFERFLAVRQMIVKSVNELIFS